MKKLLKLGISIIALLLNFNIVYAAECEDLQMTAPEDWWNKQAVYMHYTRTTDNKNIDYYYSIYKLTDNTNAAFSVYCRNPGRSSAGYWGQTFYCSKKVFDAASENEIDRLYDAGIIAILKNGYSTRNPNYNSLNNDNGYVATNLALRIYEMLSPLDTNGKVENSSSGLLRSHAYYANLWREDNTIKTLLNSIYGDLIPSKATIQYPVTKWTDASGNVITADIENEAKNLLIIGLEAAKYYKENGAASLKGVDEKPEKVKEPVITDRNGKKTYKTSLTYTFEAEKFKSTDAYIKINFNCAECTTYGVDYQLYINDRRVGQNISTINLVRYLTDGSGTIKFKIEFTGSSDTYHCEALNYKIELEWFDETIDVEAYDMYSKDCTSATSCQHFYMLYATDVPSKKTIEDSVELCSLACKDLEAQCKQCSSSSCEACKTFEEKYHSDCAECTTYIGNAVCSENDSEIDITEGYDIDTANCGNINEDNNLNVLQCVINNEDPAGNSYKATTENFEKVMNNEFCSVWCKEDYHFVLPGIKETNSGRYFSLQTSIKGAKTCYTSEIDEYDTFEEKLEEKRKEVIDAWNEWNKWYQGLNGNYSDLDNPHTASDHSCDDWDYYDCSYTNSEGETVDSTCSTCVDRCDCDVKYDGYKRRWNYDTYSYEGSVRNKSHTDYRDGGSAYCNCHSGGGKDGTIGNIVSAINGDLRSAESSLKAAIKAYTDLINSYNACSGENTIEYYNLKLNSRTTNGWKMEYEYDPTISFWYEESYMNNVLTDELQTIGSVSTGGFKQSLCSADTNNAYKTCSNGWKSSIDKNDTTSQFVCKQSGSVYTCGTEAMILSKATYVKQEMESSGEYITPTQFYTVYPTGAIVVAEAGQEEEIENSKELTNLLPVGLGTSQGVYNYALKVSDLGEYYNKSKLGRLWGNSNSVVLEVLEDAENDNACNGLQENENPALQQQVTVNNTTIKDGVYVCAYKVNCPDCPVECDPVCDNPCTEEKCPFECDEPCLYNKGETNVNYKPITPGNINPNEDREMGVNWKWDDVINDALELKAYVTTQEIEEAGEKIYDINYEDTTTSVNTEFAMQVKLDTQMINLIKSYNDQYENNDGYANNTLKCYDYTNSEDNITYDNIYCYSTFLDYIIEETGGPNTTGGSDKVKIVGGTRYFTDTERKNKTQDSGYWTTWSEASSNKWITTTSIGFNYNKNYKTDASLKIGPSWK